MIIRLPLKGIRAAFEFMDVRHRYAAYNPFKKYYQIYIPKLNLSIQFLNNYSVIFPAFHVTALLSPVYAILLTLPDLIPSAVRQLFCKVIRFTAMI